MDKMDELPKYSFVDHTAVPSRRRRQRRKAIRAVILLCLGYVAYRSLWYEEPVHAPTGNIIVTAKALQSDFDHCAKLRHVPQDPHGSRNISRRYVPGQKPVLIRNATVWTGEPAFEVTPEEARQGKGYEWIRSDVLLENGLIAKVEANIRKDDLPRNVEVIDARGRQLTAGIVDMHSHAGVDSLPGLEGNSDDNELSRDTTPYVRSIDGFNPLDPHITVIKSGGVTTSLILPGSGNNMGGEAYVVKLNVGKASGRSELSIESLMADPDHTWRYMKMACGENAKNVYGKVGRDFGPFSRLGEAWYFRHAFEQATKLKNAQDDWCETADRIGARNMPSRLPLELEWESLVALLRGQVLLNTHCYTATDFESLISHTNEFNFSVRAFHHAHQAYLVPEVLKRAYGGRTPAVALFADNMNYKAEAYIASEQAGKILYEAGVTPVYVSDNPVINSQHVLLEAAKAYQNGLLYHVALAGVTSASAELLGLGERIGKVKAGFDADIVIWDSDPLSLGATPVQVFIDGTAQFKDPIELDKPASLPIAHLEDTDVRTEHVEVQDLIISGVTQILGADYFGSLANNDKSPGNIVVRSGKIICIGPCTSEVAAATTSNIKHIHLRDGHLTPTLTAFGSLLGLEEIQAEDATSDGANDQDSFSAAVDGLAFQGKNLDAALSHGVTRAISAPAFNGGGHKGVSVGIRIGADHALQPGAVWESATAVHYSLLGVKQGRTSSFSSAINELRSKLINAAASLRNSDNSTSPTSPPTLEEASLSRVITGRSALVIGVHSADAIASLLRLKTSLETEILPRDLHHNTTGTLRLVLHGGAEAHLLAPQLASAHIPVILSPIFPYSVTWDQRRSLPGAPLTNGTAIDILHAAGVQLALGVDEDWMSRDLWVNVGIVKANSGGRISGEEAVSLVRGEKFAQILGLGKEVEEEEVAMGEFVVWEGDPLGINGQRRAVGTGLGGVRVWE